MTRMTIVGKARYVFGSVIMIGVAPEYLAIWLVWRGASLVFPSWIYQWGDDKLYSLYQRLVLFFFETCTNLEVVLYGDAVDALKKRESVLYLANHQSTVDWLVADMISVRGGSLGHLRYVMKDTLQLMPLYGHYFYAHGCIYVKRGKFSQNKMIEALDYLRHPKIPTWLVIFPEGTRYYPGNPDVIQKAEQYAKDNNLPVLKHHLVPKTRGMWLVSRQLHDKIDAIYDVSVFYDGTVNKQGIRGNAPQLIDFLMGKCKKVHVHIRRIPMSEVPMEEEKVGKWLHQLYREKDELAENFFTPDSEKRNNVEKLLNGHKSSLNLWSTLSSFLFFSVLSVPFLCTKVGRQMYVNLLLYGSLGSYGWLVIRNVC
ncbi:1-acyl-sn-glycerol-3-phosphate acyltransferase epsilon-like isoform X4 [Penaeus monodon]|uniref:1-acyl-sn-glycerol-3-phosphate acyltransferase epsilon-like isoform X4 n=1 Tax=Penaeus monodon TaxID=6687 RepID=UPI0018A6EF6B|nr:1-acyl-sn-glycerol-3-phosphate acyltransferase epsilon-like isoform X4 [Penaeus monodon]